MNDNKQAEEHQQNIAEETDQLVSADSAFQRMNGKIESDDIQSKRTETKPNNKRTKSKGQKAKKNQRLKSQNHQNYLLTDGLKDLFNDYYKCL